MLLQVLNDVFKACDVSKGIMITQFPEPYCVFTNFSQLGHVSLGQVMPLRFAAF